jgi:DNA-binding NarL/FixJ family response regulator
MRRQDVGKFGDAYSEPTQVKTHLRIGPREFTLEEPRNRTARILLVERDRLVRSALVALVNSWQGFQIVAEATSQKHALSQRQVSPDVVLVSLAGMLDMTMITELSAAFGADRLVVLLGHQAEEFRCQIGQLAHRVVMKTAQPHALRKAINEIPARSDKKCRTTYFR